MGVEFLHEDRQTDRQTAMMKPLEILRTWPKYWCYIKVIKFYLVVHQKKFPKTPDLNHRNCKEILFICRLINDLRIFRKVFQKALFETQI
jgi:hypothetical protein